MAVLALPHVAVRKAVHEHLQLAIEYVDISDEKVLTALEQEERAVTLQKGGTGAESEI